MFVQSVAVLAVEIQCLWNNMSSAKVGGRRAGVTQLVPERKKVTRSVLLRFHRARVGSASAVVGGMHGK
jgi:hypothetical protein